MLGAWRACSSRPRVYGRVRVPSSAAGSPAHFMGRAWLGLGTRLGRVTLSVPVFRSSRTLGAGGPLRGACLAHRAGSTRPRGSGRVRPRRLLLALPPISGQGLAGSWHVFGQGLRSRCVGRLGPAQPPPSPCRVVRPGSRLRLPCSAVRHPRLLLLAKAAAFL